LAELDRRDACIAEVEVKIAWPLEGPENAKGRADMDERRDLEIVDQSERAVRRRALAMSLTPLLLLPLMFLFTAREHGISPQTILAFAWILLLMHGTYWIFWIRPKPRADVGRNGPELRMALWRRLAVTGLWCAPFIFVPWMQWAEWGVRGVGILAVGCGGALLVLWSASWSASFSTIGFRWSWPLRPSRSVPWGSIARSAVSLKGIELWDAEGRRYVFPARASDGYAEFADCVARSVPAHVLDRQEDARRFLAYQASGLEART
jgi:hypothetical protein